MIRLNTSNAFRILMGLAVLFIAGCSSFGSTAAPVSAVMPVSTTTSVATATSTPLPFTGKIAFVNGVIPNYHIKVMNANGSGLKDITPPNLPEIRFLSWSPDGQYIAFDAWKDGTRQIFKIKSDGSNLVQLTFRRQGSGGPSWSSNGESIMFSSSDPGILDDNGDPATQIYIMKPDGTDMQRFLVKTKPDNANMIGSYLKNGLIAIEEPATRDSVEYYIVNSDGAIQMQYPELSTANSIAWSPDGNFVAYSPDPRVSNCWGIEIMKSDESGHKCLLNPKPNTSVYFSEMSWSPDGKYIMFSSNMNGDWNIYVIRIDGSGLSQLTNMPGQEGWEVWWGAP